MDKSENSMA